MNEYYSKLIENYGMKKEVDWIERKLKAPLDFAYSCEDTDRVYDVEKTIIIYYSLVLYIIFSF